MRTIFILTAWLCGSGLFAQSLNLMFYNVENLFDTVDQAGKFDEDFTPSGKLEYTTARYNQKLQNIARVINAAFANEHAHIVGLCEVENGIVLEDLKALLAQSAKLRVVHRESFDQRGIDNALMVDTTVCDVIEIGLKEIDLGDSERPTRGILWVIMYDKLAKEEIIVCVNHWPSRYGGVEASDWKRIKASETLQELIIELNEKHPKAHFIAMGDFNDNPTNNSLLALEKCMTLNDPCMVNMHKHIHGTDAGSHAYQGEWSVLDQILLSQTLLDKKGKLFAESATGSFVRLDWMLYESSFDGKRYPSRTYGGTKYFGGFSDHLPAVLKLRYR